MTTRISRQRGTWLAAEVSSRFKGATLRKDARSLNLSCSPSMGAVARTVERAGGGQEDGGGNKRRAQLRD